MSAVQAIMSLGLIYYAIDWPGKIYVVTIVIGMVMALIGQSLLLQSLTFLD